jgi:hypothetical protein
LVSYLHMVADCNMLSLRGIRLNPSGMCSKWNYGPAVRWLTATVAAFSAIQAHPRAVRRMLHTRDGHDRQFDRGVSQQFVLRPCTFQSVPVPFWPLHPNQLSCCVQLVPLMHNLWGFHNEGLLSVPQIKHMTYASMLLSYCSYCLSLYLLSFAYFFPH